MRVEWEGETTRRDEDRAQREEEIQNLELERDNATSQVFLLEEQVKKSCFVRTFFIRESQTRQNKLNRWCVG